MAISKSINEWRVEKLTHMAGDTLAITSYWNEIIGLSMRWIFTPAIRLQSLKYKIFSPFVGDKLLSTLDSSKTLQWIKWKVVGFQIIEKQTSD